MPAVLNLEMFTHIQLLALVFEVTEAVNSLDSDLERRHIASVSYNTGFHNNCMDLVVRLRENFKHIPKYK